MAYENTYVVGGCVWRVFPNRNTLKRSGWFDHRTIFVSSLFTIPPLSILRVVVFLVRHNVWPLQLRSPQINFFNGSFTVVRRAECSFHRPMPWWSSRGLRLVASTALLKWILLHTDDALWLQRHNYLSDVVPQRASAPIAFQWGRSLYCRQTLIANRPRYEPLHNGPFLGPHNSWLQRVAMSEKTRVRTRERTKSDIN